ncbi:hypothetical protein ACVW1A_006898 [Bradyrhizobium sp. LB1.3]
MTATFETQGLVEQLDPAALAAAVAAHEPACLLDAPEPIKRSSRTSVMALSVCALAINGAAAIYTWPSGLPSLNLSSLADLLPRQEASAPKPDPVVAALKDIQSTQQQHTASLQESNQALQQNAAVLQADSMVLLSLRQSITDERVDVKKVIFAAVHADCEDRVAAECNDVGNDLLHPQRAHSQSIDDAQADGSAIEIYGARFGWRSSLECAGYNLGPGKLKIG